ncbi:MAG TPA: acetate uptake transporter [Pseudonocardiaceae bacterium]|jgi:hypothetical protein|nr:acetate uptake transporter [Pseudonocardiaceae bacterium]
MSITESRNAAAATVAAATADPGPLGLAGFAGPFLVLSFVNAGALDGSALVATVVPFALFYGGLVQIVAAIMEFRRGNTFGTMAFATFGAFWLSFATYTRWFSTGASAAATGMFIVVLTIIAAILTLAAARVGVVMLVLFALLTVTFLVLAIASYQSSVHTQAIGGWLGVVTSIVAFYASAATLVNDIWKRNVLPMLSR